MLPLEEIERLSRIFTKKEELANALEYYEEHYESKEAHGLDFDYLVANMATKADIRNLESRFDEVEKHFNKVVNSVDRLAGVFQDLYQEMAVSAVQYKRQLEWNYKVAERLDIPFDY